MTTAYSGDGRRYDAVFLDVDGTLLWMDLDVRGYVEDLSPHARGELTVERAAGPVLESIKRHIAENIKYRTSEELREFRRANALAVAQELGVEAPAELLEEVAERRISFNPYPESERVMRELRETGAGVYAVSNWDVELVKVLRDLGWLRYFDAVIASAVVGVEKPGSGIFEEALRASGAERDRTVMVGNDPVADVKGAARAGIDAVLVDRSGGLQAPEATYVIRDLSELPSLVKGQARGR
ncbi:MAG: HAD family hydrolase [Actinomycetota bacterium]